MGTDLIVKQDMFPINRDMYVYIYIRIYPCFPADLSKKSMMMVTLFPCVFKIDLTHFVILCDNHISYSSPQI